MCGGNIALTATKTQHRNYRQEKTTTTLPPTTTSINVTRNVRKRDVFLPRWRWWPSRPDPIKKLDLRPKVEKFDVKFPVTIEMVPSCKVMVYYVRPDKEVVADTIDFDVEDKLKNQVKVP